MTQAPEPRIGHAERDRAVERLREAAGDGRIDVGELDERIETAMTARTQSELDRVLADLPTGLEWRPYAGSPADPALPGSVAADPMVISAGATSAKKSGVWEIPPWVRLKPAMGSIKLDCRRAVALSPVIEIQVSASMGSIVIVVPQGWAATTDRVRPGMGSVTNRLPSVPLPGCPLLVLRGRTGMGSLKLRHANWWERRADRSRVHRPG